jgi:hypothetical protein
MLYFTIKFFYVAGLERVMLYVLCPLLGKFRQGFNTAPFLLIFCG